MRKETEHDDFDFSDLTPAARAALEGIGEPPLDDASTLLVWGRKVIAVTTWLFMRDQIDARRARSLKDLVFALGATHNRAVLEETTTRLESALEARRKVGTVRMGRLPKDPFARGMPRGPVGVVTSDHEGPPEGGGEAA